MSRRPACRVGRASWRPGRNRWAPVPSVRRPARPATESARRGRAFSSLLLLLSGIGAISRGAGARGAEEQLASVRVGDVAAVRALQRVIARLVTVNDDLGADRQRGLGDSRTQ